MNHCSTHGYYDGNSCPGCFHSFPIQSVDVVPNLEFQLTRIADSLEKLVALSERKIVHVNQHFNLRPESE